MSVSTLVENHLTSSSDPYFGTREKAIAQGRYQAYAYFLVDVSSFLPGPRFDLLAQYYAKSNPFRTGNIGIHHALTPIYRVLYWI
jgi:hypothetical protein